jgi:hypothetical protein
MIFIISTINFDSTLGGGGGGGGGGEIKNKNKNGLMNKNEL